MTIKIICREPDPSVLKEAICQACGVKLSYVPVDVNSVRVTDYGGGSELVRFIKCLNCQNDVRLKK